MVYRIEAIQQTPYLLYITNVLISGSTIGTVWVLNLMGLKILWISCIFLSTKITELYQMIRVRLPQQYKPTKSSLLPKP